MIEFNDEFDAIKIDVPKEYSDLIDHVFVYGLRESIRGAKFPMSVGGHPNFDLTDGVKSLARTAIGHAHDQWLSGVTIQFDLTFTIKAWTELERYRFIYFISSQSTMHRISRFDIENQVDEHVDHRVLDVVKELVEKYNSEEDVEKKKEAYLNLLMSVPVGLKLKARLTTNYRELKTVVTQRWNHRLPEWRKLCRFFMSLPSIDLIFDEDFIAQVKSTN